MTNEEIEKQAEEVAREEFPHDDFKQQIIKIVFKKGVAFALTENEQLKCDLYNTDANLQHITIEYEKENAELKAQIEKMKCCGNCIHYMYGYCMTDESCHINNEYKKWELAE